MKLVTPRREIASWRFGPFTRRQTNPVHFNPPSLVYTAVRQPSMRSLQLSSNGSLARDSELWESPVRYCSGFHGYLDYRNIVDGGPHRFKVWATGQDVFVAAAVRCEKRRQPSDPPLGGIHPEGPHDREKRRRADQRGFGCRRLQAKSFPNALLGRYVFMSDQAAGTAQALAFLRRPKIPMAPSPEPKSTSAAGSGVAAGGSDICAVK